MKSLLAKSAIFACLYCLALVTPTSFDGAIAAGVASFANPVLSSIQGPHLLRMEAPPIGVPPPFKVSILLADQDPSGVWTGRRIGLDTRAVVWIPLWLGASAALAFGEGWLRRGAALLITTSLVAFYCILAIASSIALEAGALEWWEPSQTAGVILAWIEEVTVVQLGVGFLVPIAAAVGATALLGNRSSTERAQKKTPA